MDRENLPRILEIASDILNDWSLFVNESKTAFTRVFLALTEVDSHDKKIRGNEEWWDAILFVIAMLRKGYHQQM